MGLLKSEGKCSLSILCQKNYIDKQKPRIQNGIDSMHNRARALGALSPSPEHLCPGTGQAEGQVQGRSDRREKRQISRLWRYIPNMRNPLLEQGTGLQRHAERKMGWGGGALFYFWILPNQKNWGNYKNCCAETQPLPGWRRPVYK